MQFSQVLSQERQRKGLGTADVAKRLGLSVAQYEAIEAGTDSRFEEVAGLLLQFNELIEGQVNQLFYPCGLPFTEVRGYEVTT